MFPITMTFTVQDADQLAALGALFGGKQPSPAAVAQAVKETTAPKAQAAAAPAKSSTASPTTQPAAAQGASEGNVTPAATETASPTASSASSSEASASPAVDFDTLKKAFLSLSTKEGGRAKCEGVLKPHGLAKLSEAKPEQYPALLEAIKVASE